MKVFDKNYNRITPEYLENVYRASSNVSRLVNLVLSRALEDAENGYGMSQTCVHGDEFDYVTLKLACEELRRRKFRVNRSYEDYTSMDGYIGEIQIYFYSVIDGKREET